MIPSIDVKTYLCKTGIMRQGIHAQKQTRDAIRNEWVQSIAVSGNFTDYLELRNFKGQSLVHLEIPMKWQVEYLKDEIAWYEDELTREDDEEQRESYTTAIKELNKILNRIKLRLP